MRNRHKNIHEYCNLFRYNLICGYCFHSFIDTEPDKAHILARRCCFLVLDFNCSSLEQPVFTQIRKVK
jgi:hypothetical protein